MTLPDEIPRHLLVAHGNVKESTMFELMFGYFCIYLIGRMIHHNLQAQ